MKTSKKIVVTGTGSLFLFVIASLVVLRNDLQEIQAKTELKSRFRIVSVEPFHQLDFSGPWIVQIKHGEKPKVEWEIDEKNSRNARLENKKGTLSFVMETNGQDSTVKGIQVKITVPSLQSIKAVGGSRIRLKDFDQDSLKLQLEKGVSFAGHESNFKKVSCTTSGHVTFQLTYK